MQSMAERVFAQAPEKFSVCGFSMGGRVALQMMRMAPERIERLCLLDTAVSAAGPGEAAARQPLIDVATTQGMAALADAWLPPMVHPARRGDAEFMAPLKAMVRRATPEIYVRQIRALLKRLDATPLLVSFRLPVYVVVGRQDEWSTVAEHESFAALIPGAKLVIIEPAMAPTVFAARIRSGCWTGPVSSPAYPNWGAGTRSRIWSTTSVTATSSASASYERTRRWRRMSDANVHTSSASAYCHPRNRAIARAAVTMLMDARGLAPYVTKRLRCPRSKRARSW